MRFIEPAIGITIALAVLTASVAFAASEAEAVAIRTGETIGAASACGVSEPDLVEVGRKVIGWARDTARDAAELRRAQAAHEAAVNRGASRAKRAGGGACVATLRTFHALEQETR